MCLVHSAGRSLPFFWLFRDLVLRHPHVSDPLDHTVIYPRVSRAPPRLVFDALGDPLGKFFPPLSCFLVLDALGISQLSLPVFAETPYLFLKSFAFHI